MKKKAKKTKPMPLHVDDRIELPEVEEMRRSRRPMPPGHYSNAVITRRNGGVTHQFLDSIGGCSSNYR
jgi:hypothetical protein